MAIVAIFGAAHSGANDIADRCAAELNCPRIDGPVLEGAAASAGVEADKITRAMLGPAFTFNKFTHKRERLLAHLRLSLAEQLGQESSVLCGPAAQLAPRTVSHCLRVCLPAEAEFRIGRMTAAGRMSEAEAKRELRDSDGQLAEWTHYLHQKQPWDSELYDMLIPLPTHAADRALALITEHARSAPLRPSDRSRQAVRDFQLEAQVALTLVEAGHMHAVRASEGLVTITIDEYVVRLEHLQRQLQELISRLPGVEQVRCETGPHYRPTSVFTNVDVRMPERVLLVDDEGDFVLTLSERLQMRHMEPAIAHDGEEALDIIESDQPEVMILDLKMPGIDGIEVLRRVKAEHPEVEVIILTGHGSDKDRDLCLELGAFAYLEKPVDIERLSETMREANDKIRARNENGEKST